MDPIASLIYVAAAIVGVVVLYLVVRNAVTAALKAAAVWEAEGGVQAEVDARTFARTGIRPSPPSGD